VELVLGYGSGSIKPVMKIKSILIFTLLCVACNKPQTEFEQLLIYPDKKWVYVQDATLKHPYRATTYMKFDKEACENVFLKSGSRWSGIDGPEKPKNWKYDASKNTLDMYGQFFFTITKFSADKIYMINQKTRQKAYFINHNNKTL
jgi:hypothetical protein